MDICNRCGDCATKCPQGIVVAGEGGYPKIDFSRGECTFCGDCLQACSTRALQGTLDTPPWQLRATISRESCIAFRGVVCRSCGENCQSGAIRFRMVVGGYALPELDTAACNGCGACVRPCPTQSASISHATPH